MPPDPPYRILFLHHTAGLGGAETGLRDIVAHLDRRRVTPSVVLPGPGPLSECLRQDGIPVHCLPLQRLHKTLCPFILSGYWRNVRAVQRALLALLRTESIHAIHANTTTAHLYGAGPARHAAIPAFWHCRDLVSLGPLAPFLARRAAHVIAISDAVRHHLDRGGVPLARVVRIHNGIDADRFAPPGARDAVRREFQAGPDTPLIGMIGQLVPWKRHDLFLRMAQRLLPEWPAARFVIVGVDPYGDHPGYLDDLRRLARRGGIDTHVVFAGFRTDVPAVLAALDLLVHPASGEPFGRAVAEAMAAGKPVVAIDDAGPREIIVPDVSGLLVPRGDADALAAAARRLLADPALAARLGAAARDRIRQHFSLEAMIAALHTLYEEVFQDHESRP